MSDSPESAEPCFMTREDLIRLLPFVPWSGWDTPYFTMDKLKAMVVFRFDRLGDKTYEPAMRAIKADMDKRRQEKKRRKS